MHNMALKRDGRYRARPLALRWVHSFPFAYHLRMRNLLPTFSPAYASAMRRGFLRLRGFCAPSPVAQATVFRPAAVSPAPTFSRCGVSCVLFNPRPTRRSIGRLLLNYNAGHPNESSDAIFQCNAEPGTCGDGKK